MNKVGELVEEFLKNKTSSEMSDFLKGILTPKELDELTMRLQLSNLSKKASPTRKSPAVLKLASQR